MRTIKAFPLLLTLLALVSPAFPAEPGKAESRKIPYDGFTGTITKLLEARDIPEVVFGSYGYRVEDFIDDDINELYSCDSELLEYLSTYDSCDYEHFCAIIEESIRNALDDQSASVHPIVMASEEGNRVSLSIGIDYVKNILLPVYLETIKGEVKASFSIPCELRFNVGMNLEIDSDKVLAESAMKGTAISFDSFTMSVRSYEDGWNGAAAFLYNNYLRDFAVQESRVDVELYWHFCDKEGNSLEDSLLTYEQLGKGEYSWILDSICEIALSGRASDEEDEEDYVEFSYASDDLVGQTPYRVSLSDDAEGSRDLDIRRVAF